MLTLPYRQSLVYAGTFGLIICAATTNQIFAAGNYRWSERVENCNEDVLAATAMIRSDWSSDEAKKDVPKLNTTLYTALSCIDSLEKTSGVTEESEYLREQMQEAIDDYMNNTSQMQTAVTWILDSYSKSLTESLIAQAV